MRRRGREGNKRKDGILVVNTILFSHIFGVGHNLCKVNFDVLARLCLVASGCFMVDSVRVRRFIGL